MFTARRLLALGIVLGSVCLSPQSVLAEEVNGSVVSIIEPLNAGESTLVLMSSGRAIRVMPEAVEDLDQFRSAEIQGARLNVNVTDLGSVDMVDSIAESKVEEFDLNEAPIEELTSDELARAQSEDNLVPEGTVTPTAPAGPILKDSMSPSQIFSFFRSKGLRRHSQCFWRAYYWAHSLHTQRGISSEKVFLFFTPKYMRSYNYGWWFHVSPFVYSDGDELVLDATFTSGPRGMRAWTNQFMRNDAYCPTISRYYGHRAHNQDGYCYLRKTSMYYFHPSRIQRADRSGREVVGWNSRDLATSRRALP